MKVSYPSESFEQERFVNWLEENEYRFTSIPNATFTRSYAVKARNKREGLRPGLPDLLICLKNKPRLCFIEMKRVKGGKVSKEQADWITAINQTSCVALMCRGFVEAREAICELEKENS